MKKYTDLLNENGLKCTPQRLLILESLDEKGHLNIDELYSIINKKYDNMSLSTIYKNINLMIEKGVLFEVKIPNLKSVYETKKNKHIHFYCNCCNNILDLNIDKKYKLSGINNIENKIIENVEVCLVGKCENCK